MNTLLKTYRLLSNEIIVTIRMESLALSGLSEEQSDPCRKKKTF